MNIPGCEPDRTAPVVPIVMDRPRWGEEDRTFFSERMDLFASGRSPSPVDELESRLGALFGRTRVLSASSATIALLIALKGLGIGPGDEVIVSPFSWYQVARAVALAGARTVFADIDFWSFTLDPEKAGRLVNARTRAIVAGNALGHPAAWNRLGELARRHGLILIEDATESFLCEYGGKTTGTLGDLSLFQFGSPHPNRGESAGFLLSDREDWYQSFRYLRNRTLPERFSGVATLHPSMEAQISPATAILCLMSLGVLPHELKRRAFILREYQTRMRSFEGVKDLYRSPEVGMLNSFLYMVHLGTRFSRSSRDAILNDLRQEGIEGVPYCQPLYLERFYIEAGYRKGLAPIAEKLADRAIALPFHPALTAEEIDRIVSVLKDASLNVGAGASIY